MTTRTKRTIVHFSSAFLLPGFDTPNPAGDYRIDQDEDAIEGLSRLAWRRAGTFIHLPSVGTTSPVEQVVPINPADLDAALEKDQKQ
jgi:hypothetical protein